jgi:hypothetical protein
MEQAGMAEVTEIAGYLLSSEANIKSLNLQMMAALGRRGAGQHERLDVVIASFDRGLLHRWWTEATGWNSRWEPRGGEWASRAVVLSPAQGKLDVFALGLNGELQRATCEGDCDGRGRWDVTNLGGPDNDRFISHPSGVADRTRGRMRIFVKGEKVGLWTLELNADGTPRGGWQTDRQAGIPSWPRRHLYEFAPAAASWGSGRVDLFTVYGQSRTLRRGWMEGRERSGSWELLRTPAGNAISGSRYITSSPDAVAWPRQRGEESGVIHVVACGPDTIAGPTFNFASWTGRYWRTPPSYVGVPGAVSTAAIASWGRPRQDLFYVGVIPGGSFFSGPFRAIHGWTETRSWRDVTWDETSLGDYPVQYFPGG